MKQLQRYSKASFIFLCLFATGFLFANTTHAAVTRQQLQVEILNDFVLEPTKNEIFLNPGEAGTKTISVTNRTDRPVTFVIDIEDIVASETSDVQVKLLGDERGPYSLKDFLQPEIREFTLQTGERITIPVQVLLPEDAEPRGYFGAVIISAKGLETEVEANDEASGVTKVITRLGTIFLVRINGEVKESSKLEVFKTLGAQTRMYSKPPKGFEFALRNDGNVHLVHFGKVTITNIFGKEVGTLPVEAFFSLPDGVRYREVLWEPAFSMGYYKARVELYPGHGERETNRIAKSLSFLVVPWMIVIPAVILIVVLLLLVRFFKKNFTFTRK